MLVEKHINARTGITLCINNEATTIATAMLATPNMSGQMIGGTTEEKTGTRDTRHLMGDDTLSRLA